MVGTGTVVVSPLSTFCITMWLPLRRTSENPCMARIAQTSWPESTRSLDNRHLYVRHVDFIMQPTLNLAGRSSLAKELKRFLKIGTSLGHALALACDVEFRAECNVEVALALDNRSHLSNHP